MSRRLIFNLAIGIAFLVAIVLWIVSIASEDFNFSLNWAVLIVAGTAGLCFILRGLFGRGENVIKKFTIFFGTGLIVVAFLCLVWELALEGTAADLVLPIVSLIVVIGLIVGMLAVGGKRWDQGDNQNVGYKNYHQRKAEEEERRLKEEAKKKSVESDNNEQR